jgi:hypothetical protein
MQSLCYRHSDTGGKDTKFFANMQIILLFCKQEDEKSQPASPVVTLP